MRIIAGALGGRRIKAPRGRTARPTTDRVREALFSRVASRLGGLDEAATLDLYSGSGALGLEALSRGAPSCVLVERDRRCAAVIKANIRDLGLGERARVLTMDAGAAARLLEGEGARFGLMLADPPYDLDPAPLLQLIAGLGLLGPDGLFCLEHGKRRAAPPAPEGWEATGGKTYGDSVISLYAAGILCGPATPERGDPCRT